MNKSIFSDLWNKWLHSGSRLNLFIGINIIVFLVWNLVHLIEVLTTKTAPLSAMALEFFAMPAYPKALLYRFWTPFTYMFVHQEFFHILFNLLWLYWMGRIFEDFLNKQQFTFTFLAGGIAGAIFFIAFYNIFPLFEDRVLEATLLGSSACVTAIVVATATLVPDYTISMLFFGLVRLKYVALVYIIIDLISIVGTNGGGHVAHLGGAVLGFIYIKQLKNGRDWSKMFKRRRKLKVIRNDYTSLPASKQIPDQETIDRILDKISQSGYNSLTKQEKEQLFKVSDKK